MGRVDKLLKDIKESPSCFHAIENIKGQLKMAGYQEVKEKEYWELEVGKDYFVTRNDSSIVAFSIPSSDFKGFHMVASHSDSPTFRIKENPEIEVEGQYTKLNVEKYGGMILETWFDRPLSVAGRVVVSTENGIESKLVRVDRDLLMIPNLAIHMTRDSKRELNVQTDLLPLFGDKLEKKAFLKLLANEASVDEENVLAYDMYLYNRMDGTILGAKEEYMASPKLDDLGCAFASLEAFLESKSKDYVTMCLVFDNEEVGSSTKQGAGSTLLPDVLHRICEAFGKSNEEYAMVVADSFLLSADNAHALHPNRPEKADPTNRPLLNEGIVLKYHGAQKYTTDAVSGGLVQYLCKQEGIKCQTYFNHSNVAGGSTLGNILTGQVSVAAADIGLPQLAMHSSYEMSGVKDYEDMICLMSAFYKIGKDVKKG